MHSSAAFDVRNPLHRDRHAMRLLVCIAGVFVCTWQVTCLASESQAIILAVGAGGEDEYAESFRQWAEQWQHAAEKAEIPLTVIGLEQDAGDDGARLLDAITSTSQLVASEPLWIVLIGHGTFDGKVAKFNLRGPDISAQQLSDALNGAQRPLVIINCSSSSAPFLNALSHENRVVITATKDGFERNYARFGGYLAAAIADSSADLDKDQQVSVLEAFVSAAGKVAEFYESESRLATEHALLDDNGDGLGTPADWFAGTRATRTAREGAALDGLRASQIHLIRSDDETQLTPQARARRDELEQQLEALRQRKKTLSPAEYDEQLASIMVELARIYSEAESAAEQNSADQNTADHNTADHSAGEEAIAPAAAGTTGTSEYESQSPPQ